MNKLTVNVLYYFLFFVDRNYLGNVHIFRFIKTSICHLGFREKYGFQLFDQEIITLLMFLSMTGVASFIHAFKHQR